MLEYKQKRNNGRTPFAGVYKFVCVGGGGGGGGGGAVRSHSTIYCPLARDHAQVMRSSYPLMVHGTSPYCLFPGCSSFVCFFLL